MNSHRYTHLEALAAKGMSAELDATMQTAVQMINNIKSNPLSSRVLSLICFESGSEQDILLTTQIFAGYLAETRSSDRLNCVKNCARFTDAASRKMSGNRKESERKTARTKSR